MVLNTVTVGAAVTPTVIETWFSHYLNRKPLRHRPTAHISYHQGLQLVRRFLVYASHHTVEELQAFTSQWVPHPRWIHVEEVTIPADTLSKAADILIKQLGDAGIEEVGGKKWWQWRRPGIDLTGEWIEMREDYNRRKSKGENGRRVMLYVHGGAYFFGSIDEHRYQMERHARKLRAKVFARYVQSPNFGFITDIKYVAEYRLAPQFPFPCGLQDCLAAYLYLLTIHDCSEIVLAGDSAGGGMVVSILVVLRDQGLPLPAGAILISPWVDLTHSFPSLGGDNNMDYIPTYGFMQKPSAAWPPPTAVDIEAMKKDAGIDVKNAEDASRNGGSKDRSTSSEVSIVLDGQEISIQDQIQMYTTNQLISHPLVSPVLQPSLGGLPPLLVLVGGGEILRDEQIYLAHKAANPSDYPPGEDYLNSHPGAREMIDKWPATYVQLQVWDDLCHVVTTLSFTRPAKLMYRSIAQFGAWALAKAQKRSIEILDDDEISVISSPSSSSSSSSDTDDDENATSSEMSVGKAGDALPRFRNHMIRQYVSRHGIIQPLPPPSEFPALQISPDDVGVIKPTPVRRWLAAKAQWDKKYVNERKRIQRQRTSNMRKGYGRHEDGEFPPPSALVGRRKASAVDVERKRRSWGMTWWSGWGTKHDKMTLERESKAESRPATSTIEPEAIISSDTRPHTQHTHTRTVTDAGQAAESRVDVSSDVSVQPTSSQGKEMTPVEVAMTEGNGEDRKRPMLPTELGVNLASPFKIKVKSQRTNDGESDEENASTMTLEGTTTSRDHTDVFI